MAMDDFDGLEERGRGPAERLLDKAALDAVLAKDLAKLSEALAAGADADERFGPGTDYGIGDTLLARAVRARWHAGVEALLRAGADVSLGDDSGEPALSGACAMGELWAVQALLAAGAEPENFKGARRHRPLLRAVSGGSFGCVEALVQAGASLSTVDEEGATPLSFSISTGKWAMAKQLAQAGGAEGLGGLGRAQVWLRAGESGEQVLDWVESIKLPASLLDMSSAACGGAGVGRLEALHWVASRGWPPATLAMKDGATPLMAAARAGRLEACQELMELGLPLRRASDGGSTALDLAKRSRRGDISAPLLAFEAELEAKALAASAADPAKTPPRAPRI